MLARPSRSRARQVAQLPASHIAGSSMCTARAASSTVVPLANAWRLLELIEDSWGYFIPHCGHWAMLEAADDFAQATRALLDRP